MSLCLYVPFKGLHLHNDYCFYSPLSGWLLKPHPLGHGLIRRDSTWRETADIRADLLSGIPLHCRDNLQDSGRVQLERFPWHHTARIYGGLLFNETIQVIRTRPNIPKIRYCLYGRELPLVRKPVSQGMKYGKTPPLDWSDVSMGYVQKPLIQTRSSHPVALITHHSSTNAYLHTFALITSS